MGISEELQMPDKTKPDGPTFSDGVKKHLEGLVETVATTARFWDAYDAIMDLYKLLETKPKDAIRRHKPREVEQDGAEFLVFVMPSVLFVLGPMDTFCILYRKTDGRLHVQEYANCNSIEQYEQTRTEMYLNAKNIENLNELLD